MDRRSTLLGGEQRPGNSAGEGSAEFTPGELPTDRENAGEPLTGHDAEVRRFFMEKNKPSHLANRDLGSVGTFTY